MVEAAGIEPASERSSAESPTSLSGLFCCVLARVAPVGGISARQPYCLSSSARGRGVGPACDCMAPGSVPHRRGPVRRHCLLLGSESHLLVGRCTCPTFLTRRESPACTLWFSPPVETSAPPNGGCCGAAWKRRQSRHGRLDARRQDAARDLGPRWSRSRCGPASRRIPRPAARAVQRQNGMSLSSPPLPPKSLRSSAPTGAP